MLWTELPGSPDRPPTISVECIDLVSPGDAEQLIADVREAARLAFGEVTR